MADFVTKEGREITFDLDAISIKEYRALFDPKQKQAEEDETAVKVSGLTMDEYTSLSVNDQKRFFAALVARASGPVNPNLPSASS
jgi:hypothetical protein